MKPLNILFLLEDLCFGGTQKQNLELARRLDRKLFKPAILTLTGPTDLDSQALDAEIPLFHMAPGRNVAHFFFARLGKRLAAIKPDILVPCTALPNIWGRIWGNFLKISVIVGTCRGGGAPDRQHEWLLWRLANHIVCNSRALVSAMIARGVPQNRLTYIPNGVDTDLFVPGPKPADSEGPLIVCVARLAEDKDHMTLLKAFAIVAEALPSARLRLVGNGPEENSLKKFTNGKLPYNVARRVEFAGACINAKPHYAAASVFALSSIREGQPNVILEAMGCGLPVCATNVGGIPALVTENENGLLCDPKDHNKLAQNLLTLLENPFLAARFGQDGRNKAEVYSFKNMTQSHQELFLNLWKRHKQSCQAH